MSSVEHAHLREELVWNLYALADPAYQKRAWVEHDFPKSVEYDDFDMVVHFFFDDTGLADGGETQIGLILENVEEARAVSDVVCAIDGVLTKHGTKLADAEYISCPEWTCVVEAARSAIRILKEPKPPNLEYETAD